ncbi:DUF1622 domain-containing protein [Deinococcus sp. QL22]|uniref:DUF1622 domain-containing protein n=1 Tax=Deinococcus sp. QL22 TaxID=2939437 RepID=UPI002017DAF2|nr:DUF1622 domain-containing protein [Deinococcus sp. QL22]UQN06077.1 DUF1622 domain-containing protein [Deinococcus sp. QL22]
MEDMVKVWTGYVATGVEAAAALIITIAALIATWRALQAFLARPAAPDLAKEKIRLDLARWLAVALEFTLAADILRTAIAPTWDEIGKLAAIAILRTLLNYFLQREIDTHTARQRKTPGEGI